MIRCGHDLHHEKGLKNILLKQAGILFVTDQMVNLWGLLEIGEDPTFAKSITTAAKNNRTTTTAITQHRRCWYDPHDVWTRKISATNVIYQENNNHHDSIRADSIDSKACLVLIQVLDHCCTDDDESELEFFKRRHCYRIMREILWITSSRPSMTRRKWSPVSGHWQLMPQGSIVSCNASISFRKSLNPPIPVSVFDDSRMSSVSTFRVRSPYFLLLQRRERRSILWSLMIDHRYHSRYIDYHWREV